MKTIEQLISDAHTDEFLSNMKNCLNIMKDYTLSQDCKITQVQNRYLTIFCCYMATFLNYVKELACSYETLNFLSINAIGRSAVECYSLAKFIYLNYSKDTNKLFQLIASSELKQTSRIIENYGKQIESGLPLEQQLQNNQIIFNDILHFFEGAQSWIDENLPLDKILKNITTQLKTDDFAPQVCGNDGYLVISKLVSYVLKTNNFFETIFGYKIEAEVYYNLMCSVMHNNYFSIMKLYAIPNTNQYKVSLYPQSDEINNQQSIIRMLYVCFVDLINCLKEINACIVFTNEKKMPLYPSKSM